MPTIEESKRKKRSSPDPKDKQTRLLEAALELFESRGFDGVAVPKVAKKAGVATGTIYRLFADKAALANALYRHWSWVFDGIVFGAAPKTKSPREAFSLTWQRMMLFARTYPRAMRFLLLHRHGPYLDEESKAMGDPFLTIAGTLAPHCVLERPLLATLLWGASAGLMKSAEDGSLKLDAPAAAAMEDALWRAIAGRDRDAILPTLS